MNKKGVFEQIDFNQVAITDPFWTDRMKVHQDVTVDTCIKRCEETGRIENFVKAAGGPQKGAFKGRFYNDSDVYKVLEGAAYSLMHVENPELKEKLREIIQKIGAAQEDNGYLLTYFTLEKPELKWTDLDKHEMYCGGHLMEAAIAYYQATQEKLFLDIATRLADYYMTLFGPDKRVWIPGHEEIELALVKLYEVTGTEAYLDFAHWLLEQRGNGYGQEGDEARFHHDEYREDYFHHDRPVKDIRHVQGHAVRAMYLYTGMADVSKYKDTGYEDALYSVWDNLINKNLYITGGIGPSNSNEGFTKDYDLPNDTAYCETCAGIGLVMWNWRMAQLEGNGKYVDVIERALYNNILAGWSLSGDRFFYDNKLEADGKHKRSKWFDTACCPTNICRFIPSIGQYIYGANKENIYVNLFINSDTTLTYKDRDLKVQQITQYPVDGQVEMNFDYDSSEDIQVCLRYPDWCKSATIRLDGKVVTPRVEKGYLVIRVSKGQKLTYIMDMPIEKVHAHKFVVADQGKVAITRGPVVYAVESQDQDGMIEKIKIPTDSLLVLEDALVSRYPSIGCYSRKGKVIAKLIPYFAWNNRGTDKMKVWIDEAKVDTLYKY